jgi:hypothetical protein
MGNNCDKQIQSLSFDLLANSLRIVLELRRGLRHEHSAVDESVLNSSAALHPDLVFGALPGRPASLGLMRRNESWATTRTSKFNR